MASITPITKITIDSKNFQEFDELNSKFLPKMNANVYGQADQLLAKAERVLQSTINEFEGFNTALRKTVNKDDLSNMADPKYAGRFSQAAYVQKEDTANVLNSLSSAFNAKIMYPSIGNNGFDIKAEDAFLVNGVKTFKSRRAQSAAIEEIDKVGGTVDTVSAKTVKSPYRSIVSVPIDKEKYEEIMQMKNPSRAFAAYINNLMPKANKENRLESSKQTEADKKREEKEAERKEKQEQKNKEESQRKTGSTFVKVLALLGTIITLLRRFVLSAITRAAEAKANATEAHNLNMSYEEYRRYKYVAMAKGLDENAFIDSFQSVQKSFGDIKNLDTSKLETLAPVLRGKVKDAILSGHGGEEPEQVAKGILDSYFQTFLEGKTSAGVTVGQAEARRELITNLGQAFPELAKIFAVMTEQYSSGIYKGKFDNVEDWLNTTQTNQSGLSDAQLNYFQSLGTVVSEVTARFKELANHGLVVFINKLTSLFSFLDNLQIGKTATNKLDSIKDNKEANRVYATQQREEEKVYIQSVKNRIKEITGQDIEEKGLTDEDIVNDFAIKKGDSEQTKRAKIDMQNFMKSTKDTELLAAHDLAVISHNEATKAEKEAAKTSGNITFNRAEATPEAKLRKAEERSKERQGKSVDNIQKITREQTTSLTDKELFAAGMSKYEEIYGKLEARVNPEKGKKVNKEDEYLVATAEYWNIKNPNEKINIRKNKLTEDGVRKLQALTNQKRISDSFMLEVGEYILRNKPGKLSNTILDSVTAVGEQISKAEAQQHFVQQTIASSDLNQKIAQYRAAGYEVSNKAQFNANKDERTVTVKLEIARDGKKIKERVLLNNAYDSSEDISTSIDLNNLAM